MKKFLMLLSLVILFASCDDSNEEDRSTRFIYADNHEDKIFRRDLDDPTNAIEMLAGEKLCNFCGEINDFVYDENKNHSTSHNALKTEYRRFCWGKVLFFMME